MERACAAKDPRLDLNPDPQPALYKASSQGTWSKPHTLTLNTSMQTEVAGIWTAYDGAAHTHTWQAHQRSLHYPPNGISHKMTSKPHCLSLPLILQRVSITQRMMGGNLRPVLQSKFNIAWITVHHQSFDNLRHEPGYQLVQLTLAFP